LDIGIEEKQKRGTNETEGENGVDAFFHFSQLLSDRDHVMATMLWLSCDPRS
jgi:hypothetical protein